MRAYIPIIGGMVLWGCASVDTFSPAVGNDVAVSLTREADPSTARPMLSAVFTNRANRAVCFRADVFTNPYSFEVQIQVRDAAGRTISPHEREGFIPPPNPGLARLEPGSSMRGRYYLYTRAGLPTEADGSPARVQANLGYHYYPCEADERPGGALIRDLLAGHSGWQWI